MPFAILPHTIYAFLDISLPKLILGSKESNPSAWRVLADLAAGKTKNPKKKTLDRIFTRAGVPRGFALSEMIQSVPDGLPWEQFVTALSTGCKRADATYEPANDVLRVEALRMERLVQAAKKEARSANDDLRVGLDHISRWELCNLPSLQQVMGNIDTSSQERFAATASPLVITGTLYLMACGTIEYFGLEVDPNRSMIPLNRDGRLIRPMTCWLEGVKAYRQFRTVRELSDFFLYPRSEKEDLETLRRVFRNWWSKGNIPPWSRVPHIISSIAEHEGKEHREEIRDSLYGALVLIRLMDKLLTASQEIHNRWLPDYDPLSPFQDIPLIRERATAAKVALSSPSGR